MIAGAGVCRGYETLDRREREREREQKGLKSRRRRRCRCTASSFPRQVFSHRTDGCGYEKVLKKRGAPRSLPKKASFHWSGKDRDTVAHRGRYYCRRSMRCRLNVRPGFIW